MADDLLKPEEIEALLKAAGGGPGAGESKSASGTNDIGAPQAASPRSGRASQSFAAAKEKTPTERLLEQAETGLAAAVSPDLHGRMGIPPELGSPAPYDFQAFDPGAPAAGDGVGLSALQDVELDLRIELGRAELLIEEVLQLKSGSVVPLGANHLERRGFFHCSK